MRIPILATALTLIAVMILSGLGTWQLKRLTWKNEIISELNEAREKDATQTPLDMRKLKKAHKDGKRYVTGYISGEYMHSAEIAIQPRTYKGLSGYHIVTPVKLEGGGIIFVNRGWVSESKRSKDQRAESLTPGIVGIFGMARPQDKGNRFIPDNEPTAGNWFHLKIDEISDHFGFNNVAPYIFYAERFTVGTVRYPIPQDSDWQPNNNHLSYAIFWFTMIPILLVIYYLRFLKEPEEIKKS